ncbi:hypothetical protein P21_00055 [Clostridium phage P21]|nr:hypothetical protein P21_00055 [Clostridium phage P21]
MANNLLDCVKQVYSNMSTPLNIYRAKVLSTSPLKCECLHNRKLVLSGNIIDVPKHIESISDGDTVYLMPYDDGQRYFMLGILGG